MFPIGDENKSKVRPYINYTLLIVNVAIFFYFYIGGQSILWDGILSLGVIPSSILKGQELWTLITSMFMHADPLHLLGNMLYLWVFGDNIESTLGHGKYVLFYFLGGIVASFTHILSLLISQPIPATCNNSFNSYCIPSVGASGAVSAILGAYLLLFPKARIRTLVVRFIIYVARIPAMFYLGFWFIYQFLMGVISLSGLPYGVAFWAHIGGFIFGLVTVKAFISTTRMPPKQQRIIRMRRCGVCGSENDPNAIFCAYCGRPLP